MARVRHGEKPARKKSTKKVAGTGSLLQRAAAKKRGRKAAETMEPTLAPPSQQKRRAAKPIAMKAGEHPVDTLRTAKMRENIPGPTNPAMPIDQERSQFRLGPLDRQVIDDVCRMLRAGLHRVTVERLLGLSEGRIKTWIRRGKLAREDIETWHDAHDDLVQGSSRPSAFKKLGPIPEWDMFALFHACVLEAESKGEKTCVTGIIDAAMGRNVDPDDPEAGGHPDWRANAWLLSRRYGKRWGSFAERHPVEEEDQVSGGDGRQHSAVDRLGDLLDEMFGRSRLETDADELAK